MPDTLYRILRQQVVAQLPPGANQAAVWQVTAHAAICGGTQGAQLEFMTAGGEPREGTLVDDVLRTETLGSTCGACRFPYRPALAAVMVHCSACQGRGRSAGGGTTVRAPRETSRPEPSWHLARYTSVRY